MLAWLTAYIVALPVALLLSPLAQKMADNGLRAAQNHYHWGTQEGKLISLYHELS